MEPSSQNVLGVLSLMFWSLIVVISIKYMLFVMRAHNEGEGGILALMTLSVGSNGNGSAHRGIILVLGLFGASLLYGDGMITPAISVLSAMEGLEVATPVLKPYILPSTILVLAVLFIAQRHGTARIGRVFGPVILVWFLTIAILGLRALIVQPTVLWAINPVWGVRLFLNNGWIGFLVLGAVFLVVTGGEALYADMGHFGRRPIQLGWYGVALPALLLNYFGQGANILSDPTALANPFYSLAPRWALFPVVGIATLATIIASQAVISGAFSLTRQAVLLGYLPRVPIIHTSAAEIGQIYVPITNRVLFVATVLLVLGFQTSSNLAAAYGVAVTLTMLITTLLLYRVARNLWKIGRTGALLLVGICLVFDLSFCISALVKIPNGGWFPLLVAAIVLVLMTTWRDGREILASRMRRRLLPLDDFIELLDKEPEAPLRVPGAAVFMTGSPDLVPPVLQHNMRHNRVIHQTVVIMTIRFERVSHVPKNKRITVESLRHGFHRVIAHYGFMEEPDMKEILALAADQGLKIDFNSTGFFLGRESIASTNHPDMSMWRQHLFAFMSRNSQGATLFFEVPPNQVVELGVQVQL